LDPNNTKAKQKTKVFFSLIVTNLGLMAFLLNNIDYLDAKFKKKQVIHRKKRFASFPSSAGMSLPNSPWAGIMTSKLNYSCPGGV
jgi:hypothetical protein